MSTFDRSAELTSFPESMLDLVMVFNNQGTEASQAWHQVTLRMQVASTRAHVHWSSSFLAAQAYPMQSFKLATAGLQQGPDTSSSVEWLVQQPPGSGFDAVCRFVWRSSATREQLHLRPAEKLREVLCGFREGGGLLPEDMWPLRWCASGNVILLPVRRNLNLDICLRASMQR